MKCEAHEVNNSIMVFIIEFNAKSMEPGPPLPLHSRHLPLHLRWLLQLIHIPVDKIWLYLAFSSLFWPKSTVRRRHVILFLLQSEEIPNEWPGCVAGFACFTLVTIVVLSEWVRWTPRHKVNSLTVNTLQYVWCVIEIPIVIMEEQDTYIAICNNVGVYRPWWIIFAG